LTYGEKISIVLPIPIPFLHRPCEGIDEKDVRGKKMLRRLIFAFSVLALLSSIGFVRAEASASPDLGPTAAQVNIAGQWNSNIGAVYEIQQSGDQFTWSAPSLSQSGTGTISGNAITIIGPGWTVKGTITKTDTSGNATEITGENGVVLFRAAGAQSPVPQPTPPQQPIPPQPPVSPGGPISISGQWNSNIGAAYEIQQNGDQFTWSAPGLSQSGTGTILENAIAINGPGWTVKGTITKSDASGNAIEIVAENGVTLFRTPEMVGAQPAPGPPASPQAPPQQKGIPDISGKWKNDLGIVYEIKQDGDQFVWKVLKGLESGIGKITGTTVSATWTGALGSGSVKGQLLFDGSGKVAGIKWDNGVNFSRK